MAEDGPGMEEAEEAAAIVQTPSEKVRAGKRVKLAVCVSVVLAQGAEDAETVFRFASSALGAGSTAPCAEWVAKPLDEVDVFQATLEAEATEAEEAATAAAAAAQAAAAAGAEDDDGGEADGEQQEKAPDVLSWWRAVEVDASSDWAKQVDKDNMLVLTLADTQGNWAGSFPLDLSRLLDGDLEAEAVWGDSFPGCEAQYFARMPFGEDRIRALRLRVKASAEVLSPELCEALNPLSVELCTARPLPGLVVEADNPEMQQYVTDPITKAHDAFLLQRQFCQPVYATMEVLPSLFGPRGRVRTVAFQQGRAKVRLAAKTTFLVGTHCKSKVAEALECENVTVCLHDRDVELVTSTTALAELAQGLKASYEAARAAGAAQDEAAAAAAEVAAAKGGKKGKGAATAADGQEDEADAESGEAPALPPTVEEVDRQAWERYSEILREHARQQAKGEATVILGELRSRAKVLAELSRKRLHKAEVTPFSSAYKAASIKVRGQLHAVKRKIPVGGGVERAELDLTNRELLVRQPGRYFETGSEVRVAASLMFPLARHAADKPDPDVAPRPLFEKAVFLFEYANSALMLALRAAIQDINLAVLPDAESLRSYQLTAAQVEEANRGSLDIITGFQIVDDEFRVVVVEGLADKGMRRLLAAVPRFRSTEQCRVLSNRQCRYTARMYTVFDVDLKVIRLREPLRCIAQQPGIYDTFKVDRDCQQALILLTELRSTLRSKVMARTQGFPTAAMLAKLESKYGESVSIEDLDGVPKAAKKRSARPRANNALVPAKGAGTGNQEDDRGDGGAADADADADADEQGAGEPERRKAATVCKNDAYEQYRASWQERDFLAEHAQIQARMKREVHARLEARAQADAALVEQFGVAGQVFTYSGQRLNCIEKQQNEMRKRLAKQSKYTFTYAQQFQSLAFSLVNEQEVEQDEKRRAREKYITSRGFVYPVPRSAVEDRQPKVPVSEARAEELRQPYEEKPVGSRIASGPTPDFDCMPLVGAHVFGGYDADGKPNKDFFRSVHVGGDGIELMAQEAKRQAQEEWRRKVVVDNVCFRSHRGGRSEKANQLDKVRDILQGKPAKKGLRMVRNARLPSGKPVPLRTAPVSIFKPAEK